MPNMSLKKNEMPSQAPDVRNKNFKEVTLGYTAEQAVDEANRCLNCKNKPCVMETVSQSLNSPKTAAPLAAGAYVLNMTPPSTICAPKNL